MKYHANVPPVGPHGVGWALRAPFEHIRVIAMGVVKPANDDEEFWRMQEVRAYEHNMAQFTNIVIAALRTL